MLILMDDGRAHPPTRRNLEDAFQRICQYSVAGDIVWVHYSGHGGRVRDVSGDEEDGYDSTLIPVDFRNAGQILDDDGMCCVHFFIFDGLTPDTCRVYCFYQSFDST